MTDIYKQSSAAFSKRVLAYSLLATFATACLIALSLFYIDSQGRAHIDRLTENTAKGVASLLQQDLENKMMSLSEFAQISQIDGVISEQEWQSISQTLYDTNRGYQAIGWLDADFNILKVTPVEGNEIAQRFNISANPSAFIAATKAKNEKRIAITSPLESIHGGLGMGIYVPMIDKQENVTGFFSSLILFERYLEAVLPENLLSEHVLYLRINGQLIQASMLENNALETPWLHEVSINIKDQVWTVGVAPIAQYLTYAHFSKIRILFILGIALCILVGLATFKALSAKRKTDIISDERHKVEHLLKNLPGMAYQSYNKVDWPMILVSQGCEQLTGYTKEEFENHKILWGKIIYPDDYIRVRDKVNEAVANQCFFELEYRILSKNNGVRLVWEKGEAVRSLVSDELVLEGFISDISTIKQAEKDLIVSREFSDAIVNSVVEAVITIDQNGIIKRVNQAALHMFDYTYEELRGQPVSILMPEHDAARHQQYIAKYQSSNQAKVIGSGRELQAKRKDGSLFPIHASINEIVSHDKVMYVGLLRDITLQRKADDEKRLHIEQMAHTERLNSLGEMAAGIAHEVNQPLTAISLFSQSGKKLCDQQRFDRLPDIFDKLSQHAKRAGDILERMQSMTKQGNRKKERVDCRVLINEVVSLAEPDARMRDINIQVEMMNTPTMLYVDLVQVQQVLLNLLRNGMEAMQSAGLAHGDTIALVCTIEPPRYVKIAIKDSGSGVADDMLEKLFSAFSSTKQKGMGIGLSISKSIVEEHGGSIHYAENTPCGSIFYFLLPIDPATPKQT
ncbi:PAS domain S-box protein [Glaciecola sp. XM2]|uniref:PAS domain S-box protein n=1 Tax=Glaciecola sp. XM2 TaxID=1914931 RepID=UPI001BDF4360|nr:PAS domain S-box protein [Glaciecola sp. XM2]MBT1450050.1 PAS domain S-box protein [Glaciecola sp. XM2]